MIVAGAMARDRSAGGCLREFGGGVAVVSRSNDSNTVAQPLIVALQSRRFDHVAAFILLVSVGIQLVVVAALAPMLGALSAGIGFFTSQVLQTTGCIAAIVWRREGVDRREQCQSDKHR